MSKQNKTKGMLWELIRKSVHLSGLGIVLLYTGLLNFFSERIAILVLTGLLLVFLEIEYIRLEHKPKIVDRLKSLMRPHEQDNLAASVFFVISCIIAFAAFDYWIAVLAMFMTIFGDLFAALIGKYFGQTKLYKEKTLIGTLSGLAANLVSGLLILPEIVIVVIPMAFIASFVELITIKLDDNLTVPLFSGFAGQMIIQYYDITLPPLDFSVLGLF